MIINIIQRGSEMEYEKPDKETFYIEFNLQGVLKTQSSNRKLAIQKINSLIAKFLQHHDLVRIENNVDVISEEELIFNMMNHHYDEFEEPS